MRSTEYYRLKSMLKARYERDLEAIETVWRMSHSEHPSSGVSEWPFHMSKTDALRSVIKEQTGTFNIHALSDGLRQKHPEIAGTIDLALISMMTSKLHELGEIECVSKKIGKRAALYRKAGNS